MDLSTSRSGASFEPPKFDTIDIRNSVTGRIKRYPVYPPPHQLPQRVPSSPVKMFIPSWVRGPYTLKPEELPGNLAMWFHLLHDVEMEALSECLKVPLAKVPFLKRYDVYYELMSLGLQGRGIRTSIFNKLFLRSHEVVSDGRRWLVQLKVNGETLRVLRSKSRRRAHGIGHNWDRQNGCAAAC